MARAARCLLALALVAGGARAGGPADKDEPDDIPVVGRPPDLPFSGASGSFEVSARAEPTTVQAEKPLTLTLTVRATGPVRHAPKRIDLRGVPAFAQRFYVGDPAEGARHPGPTAWEFDYTL